MGMVFVLTWWSFYFKIMIIFFSSGFWDYTGYSLYINRLSFTAKRLKNFLFLFPFSFFSAFLFPFSWSWSSKENPQSCRTHCKIAKMHVLAHVTLVLSHKAVAASVDTGVEKCKGNVEGKPAQPCCHSRPRSVLQRHGQQLCLHGSPRYSCQFPWTMVRAGPCCGKEGGSRPKIKSIACKPAVFCATG